MSTYSFTPGVLLDLDGTLVDSVFQHVLAWQEAFRGGGYAVPAWRIHQAIGMGSQRLVPWVLGRHVDDAKDLSEEHKRRFLDRADHLRATDGALDLVADLETRDVAYVVATSAEGEIGEALLAALGRDDLPMADADDVGSPKPAPDLLLAAARKANLQPAHVTLVGDSPWDAEAGRQVGIRTLAVRCGGFGDDRLLGAGAVEVVDDPRALVGRL